MHIGEKELQVLGVALMFHKEELSEQYKITKNPATKESMEIAERILNKVLKRDTAIVRKTENETEIGYTLAETQGMYIALYMFRNINSAMIFSNGHEPISEEDRKQMIEHINTAEKMLEYFEQSFAAKGIRIDDFFTVHDNVKSFYKAVGRNAPCICGSGKKYKNCCGKLI